MTFGLDPTTGARLWARRYNGPGHSQDKPLAIRSSPDGSRVFVTGSSDGRRERQTAIVTIGYEAATGQQQWVARYDGRGRGSSGVGVDVAASPDGSSVYVTGSASGRPKDGDEFITLAYDATTGSRLWRRGYNGFSFFGDGGVAVQTDRSGDRVYATGSVFLQNSNFAFATITYDAKSGSRLGTVRYEGPGGASASSLAVSPLDGTVFVSGIREDPFNADLITIAYRPI